MLQAYMVIREEKHVSDNYRICLHRQDALTIAKAMTDYWIGQYGNKDLETDCFGDEIYHIAKEDAFAVIVIPIDIRESGETLLQINRDGL